MLNVQIVLFDGFDWDTTIATPVGKLSKAGILPSSKLTGTRVS